VNFFILCFGILFFSPFLLLFIKRRAGETPPESWLKGRLSRQTMASLPASTFRLFYLLLFFWLAYTFFSYGVDYLFNRTVIQKIPDENELASFFGEVGFISLGVVFFYQIFLAGRFEAWFGVNRLVAFTGFLFFGGMSLVYFSPSLAAMAFTEGLFVFFIDFAATTFLEPVTNLFPDRFRGRMKVLIDGFGRPFGSLLLLVFALAVSWKWDLGKMSLVLWIGASLSKRPTSATSSIAFSPMT
jgi:hypothetical protein